MAEKQGMSGCAKFGIGCGIVLVIFLIAGGIGVWYVATNLKGWAASVSGATAKSMVEQMQLPEDQKQRVVQRIDQTVLDYKNGKITDAQIKVIFQRVSESPMLYAGLVTFAEMQYVNPSGLSEDEKAGGRLALQRVARAVSEGKLNQSAIERITAPIAGTDTSGKHQLKSRPTDDDIRKMLALARSEADSAGIPEEPFQFNVADEFERAIDEVLSGGAK